MNAMNHESRRILLFALATTLAIGFICISVDAVQVAQTVTATTTVPTTVTATATSTQISLTTSTTISTLTQGAKTIVTSITNTSHTTSSTTTAITEISNPPTVTSTTTSTQSTSIFGNTAGELLVVIASLTAVAVVATPRIMKGTKRGITCERCGYRNPPFATTHCTNCGQPLRT